MEWFVRYIRFSPVRGFNPNRDGVAGFDDRAVKESFSPIVHINLQRKLLRLDDLEISMCNTINAYNANRAIELKIYTRLKLAYMHNWKKYTADYVSFMSDRKVIECAKAHAVCAELVSGSRGQVSVWMIFSALRRFSQEQPWPLMRINSYEYFMMILSRFENEGIRSVLLNRKFWRTK